MSEPLVDSQNPVRRPRPRRRLSLAAGALAVALAIGGGVGIAAASTTHPAAASAPQAAPVVAATGSAATSTVPSTSGTAPKARTAPKACAARAARARQPHLEGTVTAVGNGTITIKDREGFLRQLKTSSKTVYKGALKSPLAVGTHILARGTIDANHTSLDATIIRKAPARAAAGKRHHRKAKHGAASTPRSSKSAPSPAPTSASPTTS
ncbi:MAG: hypothetical protein ACR2P2_12425 [Nakamurella sp.]